MPNLYAPRIGQFVFYHDGPPDVPQDKIHRVMVPAVVVSRGQVRPSDADEWENALTLAVFHRDEVRNHDLVPFSELPRPHHWSWTFPDPRSYHDDS